MQLHDECTPDAFWRGHEVAADSEFRYLVVPMIYNHRLIMVRPGSPEAAHGWCFKTSTHAIAAIAMWEPDTQDEPLLWHKRAGDLRRAPHRDQEPDYNRPRCTHGTYLHEQQCDIDPFCPAMEAALITRRG